jgi:hypothetical protein
MTLIGYLLTPFMIYFHLDLLPIIQTHILTPIGLEIPYLFYLFLPIYLLSPIPALQVTRVLATLCCVLTIGIHLILSVISHLTKSCSISTFKHSHLLESNLHTYRTLELIIQIFSEIISLLVALLMGFGFVFSVSSNFLSLKMITIIPMPLYLFFPLIATLLLIMIQCLLPMAINIYERALILGQNWKFYLQFCESRHDLRYFTRKIKSIQPVRIRSGLFEFNLYYLKRSTKVTFYTNIVSYTITALLSINVH